MLCSWIACEQQRQLQFTRVIAVVHVDAMCMQQQLQCTTASLCFRVSYSTRVAAAPPQSPMACAPPRATRISMMLVCCCACSGCPLWSTVVARLLQLQAAAELYLTLDACSDSDDCKDGFITEAMLLRLG